MRGSGTGELRGLRGEALISVASDGGHSFTLDYELGEDPVKATGSA